MGVELLGDVARALVDASAALLFGASLFQFAVARPSFEAVAGGAGPRLSFDRFHARLSGWGLGVALLGALLWLYATTLQITDEPLGSLALGMLATVLRSTSFGSVWLLRSGLLASLGVLFLVGRAAPSFRRGFGYDLAAILLSVGFLASIGLAGHAFAEQGTARIWHLGGDMLHLLGAGAWLGALPPLAFVLARGGERGDPAWPPIVCRIVMRFTVLGMISVGLIILTGLVNSWYLVGTIPALFGTAYGRILLLKLCLVAVMLALAIANHRKLTPQLRLASVRADKARPAMRAMRRNSLFEIALGAALLLVVGVLVGTAPALHEQPVWPFPITISSADVALSDDDQLLMTAVVLAGLAGLLAIVFGWRRHWPAAAAGAAVLLLAAILVMKPYILPAYPTTYFHSPLPYSAQPVARGEVLYRENCVPCHGASGYGDGPVAASLPLRPSNLAQAHVLHHGDGTLFWWISHGIPGTPMPAADYLSQTQRWSLVEFLRARVNAEAARDLDSDPDHSLNRRIAAPDFVFQRAGRPQESLRALRGTAVLLILYSLPASRARLAALAAAEPRLRAMGLRVVAVPIAASNAEAPDDAAPILAAPSPEIVTAFSLFGRDHTGGLEPMPAHMELLIDRGGYLRARWLTDSGVGDISGIADLPGALAKLALEPAEAAPAESHMH